MKRLFSAKPLFAVAIALGAVAATSAAHARSDVIVSIGFNVPVRHVEPAPVYVQPQPVYVQPRPAYNGHRDYGDRHYAQRSGPHGDSRTAMAWRTGSTATRAGSIRVLRTAKVAGAMRTTTVCGTASTAPRTTRTATDRVGRSGPGRFA
jgi:hypothetical protein